MRMVKMVKVEGPQEIPVWINPDTVELVSHIAVREGAEPKSRVRLVSGAHFTVRGFHQFVVERLTQNSGQWIRSDDDR